MARRWLIAISVIAVIVVGLLLLGFIPLGDSNASDMEIIFYDADGNELGRTDTLSLFGIQRDGIEGDIHSLDVVVYFKVTTDIDYTYISSRCDLTIVTTLNTQPGGHVHTVAEHKLGATNTDLDGSFYATYLMSTLLPDSAIESVGKEYGWSMSFNAKVASNLGYGANDEIRLEDTCGTRLSLTWGEASATLDSWFGNW